jgi:hypothetical protein
LPSLPLFAHLLNPLRQHRPIRRRAKPLQQVHEPRIVADQNPRLVFLDAARRALSVMPAPVRELRTMLVTTNQEAIRALFRVVNRYVGNSSPMPGVFPDYPPPVVRNVGAGRERVLMRWSMPPPPRIGGPVTNIRSTSSPRWRGWL